MNIEAIEYYNLSIEESEAKDNNSKIALSYSNLGEIFRNRGEYEKALEYFLKSVDIEKSIYGDNDPSVATSYKSIGNVYQTQGEYEKAMLYLLMSVGIRKAIYGRAIIPRRGESLE